jgi:L-ascorbate metabolism protein UlaG (beta-lactamase superfamily)
MIIKWQGHASFVIKVAGKSIVTDPFDEKLGYPLLKDEVDIATISHEHWDHSAVSVLKGNPKIIREPGRQQIGDIVIEGIKTYHDKTGGSERGENIIFKIAAEGLNIVHLGDLGLILADQEIERLGTVDVLMIPVGGIYTLNAKEANILVEKIQPRLVIPMHYATPHLSFELEPLENFTEKYDKVIIKKQLEISKDNLPFERQIVVLDYLEY